MKLNEDQQRLANLIAEEARRQGVNPQLAVSVAFAESNFNPSAVSPKGAIGLMQLMPATAKELGVDPTDVTQNIQGGVRYLKQLGEQFENNPIKVLSAYNAGPNARFFQTNDPKDIPTETLEYVNRIAGVFGGNLPEVRLTEKVEVTEPASTPSDPTSLSRLDPQKINENILKKYSQYAGGFTGLGLGLPVQGARLVGGALRGDIPGVPRTPSVPSTPAAPTTGSMEAPARPGPVRPPLGGTGTQNYAKAFGLGDIEAGRAIDMTKQPGGVHDLASQRRTGLQRVNELFPNQFREDPRFGGLMTPEQRPGAGPRGPTGQIGAGKPPPIVKPPGALDRVTKVFTDMASKYPSAARSVSTAAQRVPIVSYPLAGANIGGELSSAYSAATRKEPDYLEAGLSGLGALGTGLSLYPPTAPFGIPMMLTPPLVRYLRENQPEEDPSLGLQMP